MARDFIKIDRSTTTATQSGELAVFISTLRDAYARGVKILAVMGHLNDGTVFTDIETLYGLPTGKGQTVFNLVNGAVGSMGGAFQTSDAKNITETVG